MKTDYLLQNSFSKQISKKAISVFLSILMFASIVPMGTLSVISHAITPYKTNVDIYDGINIVETVTQYRYRTKSTTTNTATSLSGWIRDGGSWQLSSTKSFNYASFPDGFDTSHSIYTSFHKSCDVSSYTNETNKREVSTSSAGYVYYKWDYNAQYANRTDRTISHIKRQSGQDGYAFIYFHANTSSINHPYLDNYYCNSANLPSYNCSSEFNTTALAGPTPRFFRFSYSTCTYRDYYMLFNYYKWSDWSDWSDTAVSATSDREVETRTLKIDEYGIRYSSDLKTIISVPTNLECNVFNVPSGVLYIDTGAFENCTKIESVVFSSDLKTIGARAFYGCTAIEEINIPSSISSIGTNAFTGCSSLVSVYFNHKNPPTVGSSPFSNTGLTCIYVYFLDLKDSWLAYESSWAGFPLRSYNPPGQLYSDIDSNNTDEQGFRYTYDSSSETATVVGYSGGGDVLIPRRIIKDSVSYYVKSFTSDVFCGNTALTSVSITKDITSIPAQSFKNCTGLRSVYYEGVLSSLGSEAFYGCSGLTAFDYLNKLSSIPDRAFYGCSSLSNISLPSSLTSIGDSAFYGCSALGDISIPSKTSSIGTNAFYGCANTVTVTFNGSVNTIGNNAFGNCSNLIKANFKSNPPYSCGANIFSGNNNFFISYPNNNSVWNSQVHDYLWHEFNAYSVSMINQVGDGSKRPMYIKVVSYTGAPIRNATVTLNGASHTTLTDGSALFGMPTSNTANLRVNPNNSNFETYSNSSYPLNKRQTTFVIKLGANHSVSGVSLNDHNISTGSAVLNRCWDQNSSLIVRATSPLKIQKLQIISGNTVIAEKKNISSGTYTFSIYSGKFLAGKDVLVKMLTEDGKVTQKKLSISVFNGSADVDLKLGKNTSDPKINLKGCGNDLLESVSLSLPISSWLSGVKFYIQNNDDSVKIGINFEPSKNKKNTEAEVLNSLKKNADQGFKVAGGFGGYVNLGYNINTKSLYIKDSVVLGYVEVKGHFEVPFTVVVVPLIVLVDLSGKATIKVTWGSEIVNSKPQYYFDGIEVTIAIGVKPSLGVNFGIGSAGVYGEYNLEWKIPKTLYGSGEAGLYAKVGWVRYDLALVKWKKKQLLPRTKNASRLNASNIDSLFDIANYTPIDRSYLETRSDWLQDTFSSGNRAPVNGTKSNYDSTYSSSTLQSSTYNYIEPQIVVCDDVIMMVYADDIAGRTTENMQALVYSIYDPSTATWSAPEIINDTGSFDNDYQLYTDGSDIYVVYTTANRVLENGVSMEDTCKAMDVVVVRYNPELNSFDSLGKVTSDEKYDMFANIAVVNGVPTVAWVANENGNIFGMDQTNSIKYSTYVDGAWTEPVEMAQGLNLVSCVAVGSLNGNLAVSAIVDADSDPSTNDDNNIILLTESNSVKEIGTQGYYATVQFVEYNNQNALVWNESGTIKYITGSEDDIHNMLSSEDNALGADFRWVDCGDGKYAITYVIPDESEGSDVYTVYYDGDKWTSPIRVTNTSHYIGAYDAVFSNDRFIVPYRDTEVTFTEESFTTSSNLCVAEIVPSNDLYVTDAIIDRSSLVFGESSSIGITVFNNGFNDVDEATIVIKDAEDNIIYSGNQTLELHAGETKSVDVDFTVPSEVTDGSYTIYVMATENNTSTPKGYSIDLWQYDLCVETEQLTLGTENSLIINVTNDGFVASPAGMVKTAYGSSYVDVETYAEIELPSIDPGETVSFIVELTDDIFTDADDSGLITAWVETDGNDFFESNNYITTAIAVFEDVEVFYDEELVQSAPELTPDTATVDLVAVSDVQISVNEHRNTFSYIADLDASHYTYSNGVLTLNYDYLAGLEIGTYTLSLVFNANEENETTLFFTLIVEDTTPTVLEGDITVEGEAVFGSLLTVNTDGITSEAPEYEIEWYRGDQLVSEEGSYMITESDIGQQVFAIARGINSFSGVLYSNVVVPAKANGQTLFSPTAKYIGYYTIELVPCEGYEYSFNSGEWADETVFDDLTPNTAYVFRMRKAETNVSTAGTPSDEVVFSTLGLPVEGTIQINGIPERGKTLTAVLADYGDSTFTYQWYRNNEPINGATQATYLLTADDVNSEIFVKAIGSGEYAGELISDSVAVSCVHEYTWTVTEESTCKKTGTKVGVCVCGDRKEETIPLKDHVPYTSREAKDATCTDPGNTIEISCRNCGDVLTAATVINPTGHRYGEWTSVDDSTHRRICQNDPSHVETANHSWSENVRETAPTCTTNGERVYTCTVCNGTKVETVNKLNHNYEVTRRTEATCTQPGEIVYVCKNDASHTYTDIVPPVGHIDENHDGYCDYGCGTYLGDPTPGNQEDLCKYCGKVHTGPMAGLIKFFHNLAYFFAHLFGRM